MSEVLHLPRLAQYAEPRSEPLDLDACREFIYRLALVIAADRDLAEDICQDALLRVFRSRERLVHVEKRNAWIRQVTVRCALSALKRRRMSLPLAETIVDSRAEPHQLEVVQVLERLSAKHRVILALAIGQRLSYREIAEALKIPEGTVASRLSSAKIAFQKEWEK